MSIKTVRHLFCTSMLSILVMAYSGVTNAGKLGDVNLPDNITIDGTSTPLQLNGMGYRTKFFFKIYVGALYTENRVTTRDDAQALNGPKRILMYMLYDEVSHEKMADAWQEGFEDNHSSEQMKKLASRLQTFISYFPDLKAGDVVLLDYIPATGTRVTINGEVKGSIEGADFNAGLLDVWLGEEPADEDLKAAMLGEQDD